MKTIPNPNMTEQQNPKLRNFSISNFDSAASSQIRVLSKSNHDFAAKTLSSQEFSVKSWLGLKILIIEVIPSQNMTYLQELHHLNYSKSNRSLAAKSS